jgi:hypothetical protein
MANAHPEPSSSRSLTLTACSFGLRPPLSSHASILLRRTSCDVAGVFTVTVVGIELITPDERHQPALKFTEPIIHDAEPPSDQRSLRVVLECMLLPTLSRT